MWKFDTEMAEGTLPHQLYRLYMAHKITICVVLTVNVAISSDI